MPLGHFQRSTPFTPMPEDFSSFQDVPNDFLSFPAIRSLSPEEFSQLTENSPQSSPYPQPFEVSPMSRQTSSLAHRSAGPLRISSPIMVPGHRRVSSKVEEEQHQLRFMEMNAHRQRYTTSEISALFTEKKAESEEIEPGPPPEVVEARQARVRRQQNMDLEYRAKKRRAKHATDLLR